MIIPSILFVCTGNVFRSMSAEYCLRGYLNNHHIHNMIVHSAGIEAFPESPRPMTLHMLDTYGFNAHHHRQTKVTQDVLDAHTVVIAMAMNHYEYLRKNFHRESVLFNEIVIGQHTSVLDLGDAVPNALQNAEEENKHIQWTVRYIHDSIPAVFQYIQNRYTL